MLTGFEALGAASAVLQVISFATDVAVACKDAYDGATTSQDDLQRYAGQMSEAVGRVHTRCEQMSNMNSKFASPKLQNITKECKDVAEKLEAEVQYVTGLQAKGNLVKSLRKAFRVSKYKKKIQALHESLSINQQVVITEITSHLCSQSDAIYFQQDESFGKLDTDVQFLIGQLAQGITDVKNLVKQEHTVTRNIIIQESGRVEVAINSHMDSQVLDLRTTTETQRKCEVFLQSLKAPRMNQRYNDVMDSEDASFNQVFATYEDMIDMYFGTSEESGYSTDDDDPEDDADTDDDSHDSEDVDSGGYEFSEAGSYLSDIGDMDGIYRSWDSFNMWLQSDDKVFYIQGKPGSGKSTLVKFILNQDQTQDLIKRWSPDAIILSHFFWKIGLEEQNSIKGLWCSLLYKRLKDQQHLILGTLQHFSHLSLHSGYHDWSIKDLQDVWTYVANLDPRHMCVFIDGLDEIRNEDGFPKLVQTIQSISRMPNTKLCVSTRPEAQIVRWLEMTDADGILLEELTKLDMHVFAKKRFDQLLPSSRFSSGFFNSLRRQLVHKAEGVFLWLYLAIRSIIDGIENEDSEDLLSKRLHELPGDLKKLYGDMWQRANAKSTVYQDTARRYFHYLLSGEYAEMVVGSRGGWTLYPLPLILQIACAERPAIQERLLTGTDIIGVTEIMRICDETSASIHTRCAGLLEVQPGESDPSAIEEHVSTTAFFKAFGTVGFIHRTAHDFLIDTEEGQAILGCESMCPFPWQTRLLKGATCMVKVLVMAWDIPCRLEEIIRQITDFVNHWRSRGLQLATEMLNVVQLLFDKHFERPDLYFGHPQRPFLRYLINHQLLDDYVVSCLEAECSPSLATTILRDGWYPGYRLRMSSRIFKALIAHGADPGEYGVISDYPQSVPFVRKATAFTDFLVSFLTSTKQDLEYYETQLLLAGENDSSTKLASETVEIALHMANTCQNLDAAVALFACYRGTGSAEVMPLKMWTKALGKPTSQASFVVYEINIQLLILCLLSKMGEYLAEGVLASPEAEDVLSKIDNPSARVRYFRRPNAKKYNLERRNASQPIFERVVTQAASLSRSDIEHLFDVDLKGHSQVLSVSLKDRTDLKTITQYIENLEVEEVCIEDAMTSLVAENVGFCTSEELGIAPTSRHVEFSRRAHGYLWDLFPLAMGRLEAEAAASGESKKKKQKVVSDTSLAATLYID
ncbi:hypothetical protein FGADI_11028 [Fusarium gaditjirri]|uniref:NACHT domain-containing protein n=1 Tax=Fusarium gaditjirri TaxID=282569 RepID=A0A8H4WR09_9HYPO|nr:hypothetical protein FGADI_11028 [Fusarium gaditjirri]